MSTGEQHRSAALAALPGFVNRKPGVGWGGLEYEVMGCFFVDDGRTGLGRWELYSDLGGKRFLEWESFVLLLRPREPWVSQ